MARKSKIPPVIPLETERLILKPISPFSFARQTFHWTKDGRALADLNMPASGWTFYKWWKQMRKLNRKKRLAHGIWLKGEAMPIGLFVAAGCGGPPKAKK